MFPVLLKCASDFVLIFSQLEKIVLEPFIDFSFQSFLKLSHFRILLELSLDGWTEIFKVLTVWKFLTHQIKTESSTFCINPKLCKIKDIRLGQRGPSKSCFIFIPSTGLSCQKKVSNLLDSFIWTQLSVLSRDFLGHFLPEDYWNKPRLDLPYLLVTLQQRSE